MTVNEVQGFRTTLTARVAELERITRQRDGIAIERSADIVEEVQCASERALAVGNPKRLAAVPWAAFCIQCQEAVDRGSVEFEMPIRELLARAA